MTKAKDKMMNKRFSDGAIIVFLFNPIVSILLACGNLMNKLNGVAFILFYAIFGFAHSFADIRSDAFRKMVGFSEFPSYLTLDRIWQDYIGGINSDIFQDVLFLVCRLFTDDARVPLCVVGLIGGTFIYLTLRKVLTYIGCAIDRYVYIILILFVILFNPVIIGGIRNFTAMAMFAYFAFQFLLERKNMALIGVFLCCLVHFSFILNITAILIARFFLFKKPLPILWWAAIVACVSSIFINPDIWQGIFGWLSISSYNEEIGARASSYSSDETAAAFGQSLTVYLQRIGDTFIKILYLVILFYFKKEWHRAEVSSSDNRVCSYMLFFLTFGYMMSSFSIVGARYLMFGQFLLYFLLLRLYMYQQRTLPRVGQFIVYLPIANVINIAWTLVNSWFLLDHRFFYVPIPFLYCN